jgi:hypothetical protein
MGDDGESGTKTFTQADLDRAAAAGAHREREKLNAKYADYDDLKAAASNADKSKSQLDKLTEQMTALAKRAESADLEVARRDVADEFGLTRKEARRLSGKSADELRADAQELVDDLGIDVAARKAKTTTTKTTTETDGDAGKGTEGDGTDDAQQGGETDAQRTPAAGRRPKETLRSGAPGTTGAEPDLEKMDPLELVAKVPRR